MKFHNQIKGKIVINIDKVNDKLNSNVQLKGLAKEPEVTLTTLLVNFVSIALHNGKNPEKIISTNIESMIEKIKRADPGI